MNEREKFVKSFYARIALTVDRIATMTESQVLNSLRAMESGRESAAETLAFLNSVAIPPTDDSERGVSQLRSELSSREHPGDQQLDILDYIENALKKRLEELRKRGE